MRTVSDSSRNIRAWFMSPALLAFWGLLGLLFIYYPELFFVKAAPLTGDHLEQHYPWAYLLSDSLKHFKLPFWTPMVHCGFPLVAESQIGAFYLPNLMMYFFLPFRVAYSYMNLIHWLIAGGGTYAYAKRMNLGSLAAFVAAVIFVFGAAYGGAYYNMTSLKAICWFPVVLYLFERFLEKYRWSFLIGMTVVIGQSLVAGYLQMAVLTWLIFGVYVILRIFFFGEEPVPWPQKVLALGSLVLAALVALVFAMPQIYMTFQLAMLSNRTGLEEGFAYVGSMSPMVLGTLINPNLSTLFHGSNLYEGGFSLFLVLFAFYSPDIRKSRSFRIWGVMSLIALLLALGQWSPVYVLLIKVTKFYSFRIPAKFLGFICFGFAMLAASGFDALWQGKSTQSMLKKALHAYVTIVAVFMVLMGFANLFLTVGRNIAFKMGRFFVKHFIYAKSGHPHSLETYLAGVQHYPESALKFLSLVSPVNVGMTAMAVVCICLTGVFLQKKTVPRTLLIVGILFLVVDLYAASYLDIRQDFAAYKTALASSPVLKILGQEKAGGRLGRIYGFRSPSQRLPLVPSENMPYGIDDIGVYSPLVTSRYYQTIGLFGNVDDSNYAITPTPAFVCKRLPLLSFLNVSHILSAEKLTDPGLQLLFSDPEGPVFLYVNRRNHAAACFALEVRILEDWPSLKKELLQPGFDPAKVLLLEKKSAGSMSVVPRPILEGRWNIRLIHKGADQMRWDLDCSTPGFFITSDLFYPGWKAYLNGTLVPILPADGLFRAVEIKIPGIYQIEFRFRPQGPFESHGKMP